MRIGELARGAGCDVETVRFYEREGLLDAPARDASGYRRYDEHHLTRLSFIRHSRTLDLPLAEIRRLLEFAADPGPSCERVDALLDRHIALVRERLRHLQALETQLLALRRCCDGAPTHPCAILDAFLEVAERRTGAGGP